jgi:hypothetical protein
MADENENGTDPKGGNGETPGQAPGTEPEKKAADQPMFTQAEIDRRVNEAVKTREAKLRQQMEEQKLKDQNEFKALYEKAEAEKNRLMLRSDTARLASELAMPELVDVLDADLATIDGRKGAAEQLKKLVDARVEAEVARRLTTNPAPTKGSGGGGGSLSADEVAKLSIAEYEKARREGRIK